jgi:hypothetical protein
MDRQQALTILQNALDRCRDEDMRTPEVFEALDFLAARRSGAWQFKQFRDALDGDGMTGVEKEGRWQVLNASLNGIKLLIAAK